MLVSRSVHSSGYFFTFRKLCTVFHSLLHFSTNFSYTSQYTSQYTLFVKVGWASSVAAGTLCTLTFTCKLEHRRVSFPVLLRLHTNAARALQKTNEKFELFVVFLRANRQHTNTERASESKIYDQGSALNIAEFVDTHRPWAPPL